LYAQQPELPDNPKTLKISILGVPNSGKSTLINRLLNLQVNPVSSKINTTRKRSTNVLTEEDTQIVKYF
jgi:GTPase